MTGESQWWQAVVLNGRVGEVDHIMGGCRLQYPKDPRFDGYLFDHARHDGVSAAERFADSTGNRELVCIVYILRYG